MSFSLIPDYLFRNVCAIEPDFLLGQGIKLLLVDLDNTIAPYSATIPAEDIAAWADMIKMSGIELFIITNNTGSKRVESLAAAFGIGYIMRARKPFTSGIKKALAQRSRTQAETALVGDQIFTDILAANCAGITSVIVRPIRLVNPLLMIRYWLEAPYRALCKHKER